MVAEWTTLGVVLVVGLAELWHAHRCRRVAHLAFGPAGRPRAWVHWAPGIRIAGCGLLVWGLVNLLLIPPAAAARRTQRPEGGYRHLIIALDVSPSMKLPDAGEDRQTPRSARASEVLMSVLQRLALDQVRISVVAFYTSARPVVVNTYDLEVVKNILDELPLAVAFDTGQTKILDGIRESFDLARAWPPNSTTVLVVSDGDTVPDTGMPERPAAVAAVFTVGVGDPRTGSYIDGHQSRQDTATMAQVARRLGGVYFDANARHLPSDLLAGLAQVVPMKDTEKIGPRELSLTAVGLGATLVALLPLALALAGSQWQFGKRREKKTDAHRMAVGAGAAPGVSLRSGTDRLGS